MSVEVATFIHQLNPSYPTGAETKAEGDNHIRMFKGAVQNSFPNISGAVTVTHSELNSVTSRSLRAGDTYTGTHAFAGATAVTVPTVAGTDSTTNAASTAMVQSAIASVNAQTPSTLVIDSAASVSATAGQHICVTNASTVTVTLPASPSAGQQVWVTPCNGRTDTVVARNGQNIMSLAEDMTIDNMHMTAQLRYVDASVGWRLV